MPTVRRGSSHQTAARAMISMKSRSIFKPIHLQSQACCVSKKKTGGESDALKVYPLADLELVDNLKGDVVARAVTDENGHFELTIPYFSQYHIKVVGSSDHDEAVVSLDLGKTRYGENKFDLVVVKNSFKKEY